MTKFGNSSIAMRKVTTKFYKDLNRKSAFLEGWSWFKFNNLGLARGADLEFYTSVVKGLKLKARVFFFFNWDSPHARLNSHYEAWSYKKRSTKRITGYRKSV